MTSDYRHEAIRGLTQLSTMMHMGGSREMAARLQNRAHVLEMSALAEELDVAKSRMEVMEAEEQDRNQQDIWYANELKHRGGSGIESPYAHHHQASGGPRQNLSARRHYRTSGGNNSSVSFSPNNNNKGSSPPSGGLNNSAASIRSKNNTNNTSMISGATSTSMKASYGINKSTADASQALIRGTDPRTTGPAAHAIETKISLVETLAETGRITEAISLMRRALSNYEEKVCRGNLRHPALLPILIRLASLVEETGDVNEARCIRDRVRHIGQDAIGITNEAKFERVIGGERGLLNEMGGPLRSTVLDGTQISPNRQFASPHNNNRSGTTTVNNFSRNGSRVSNLSSNHSPSSASRGFRGGGGDASPGSVAGSRQRNVFSYSFLNQQE